MSALELEHVCKTFGALAALDDVTLSVARSEILAVVGENGAGKSTLMNVAYGLYRPDSGRVRAFESQRTIGSPAEAIALGVGMVHQHFMLVPTLTVAENVVLGREPKRRGLLDRKAAAEGVRAVAERFGFELDPLARVEQISLGMQQRVEIVKALYRGAELLILDEPTANLTPQESDELLRALRGLSEAGKTVVFISHKLREVLAVAHSVAVMRRGRLVAHRPAGQTSAAELSALMVGRRVEPMARCPSRSPLGEARVKARNLVARSDRGRAALQGVSFELCAGELLAVAGVDGNGQPELAEVLTGLRPLDGGTLEICGRRLDEPRPSAFRAAGVAHVPADRQQRGLCLSMRVDENLALGRHAAPPFARGWAIDRERRRQIAARLCAEYDVRPDEPALEARALSGGNQQKVILARELDSGAKVLVAVQPTRGLDAGAIAAVHERLRRARDEGCAILLISLDLDEVLALADRILVLFGGRAMGILPGEGADERLLGRMMLVQAEAARPRR
jgi:ABC-type uncharacterized transport system ATPase subunit